MNSERENAAGHPAYVLDEQVGFILRQVAQRHFTIFTTKIGEDLTPTQWAALVKLHQVGPQSQNLLGRLTAMDAATIKGVVDRLAKRGLTESRPDPEDGRRLLIALTSEGDTLVQQCLSRATAITEETLAALTSQERETLIALLKKML